MGDIPVKFQLVRFSDLQFIEVDPLFSIHSDQGATWLEIFWGNYRYEWDMDRIRTPEDILWFLVHIGEKEWPHATGERVAILIEAICREKGWKPYSPIPHQNEAPPAWRCAKDERAKLTPSLRYAVIRRDGHRCRSCGATVATGAMLEVDHIIPVASGGKTNESNLQTLCSACNRGKMRS